MLQDKISEAFEKRVKNMKKYPAFPFPIGYAEQWENLIPKNAYPVGAGIVKL